MAETSPPPTAGAESCSEEPARGGEQLPEEPRRTPAGGADREGEAGPPLASPAGQSEPGSPVAAPFFLLYPGDGGAGFAARPPPQQQQRSWRTPPSPGSPLPFLLLSYPSGGGGGKHREWRREEGTRPRRVRWVRGNCRGPGAGLFTSESPQAAGSRPASPPLLGRALVLASLPRACRVPAPGPRLGAFPGGAEEGAAPRDPAARLARLLRAPGAAAAE